MSAADSLSATSDAWNPLYFLINRAYWYLMTSPNHVVGIILNWNNYDDTKRCIDNLQGLYYQNFDLILVDNGSTDGSYEKLVVEYDELIGIKNSHNLGFGGGINAGIERARSMNPDYIWVLNNDIIIDNEYLLDKMVGFMDSNRECGIMSPTVMKYPEKSEYWFENGVFDRRAVMAFHGRMAKRILTFRNYNVRQDDSKLYNDYIPFCSALIRNSIFADVGLYPEKYFLYYGDVEYCFRVREKGFKIYTDKTTQVYHRVSAGMESRRSPLHLYYLARNRQILNREINVSSTSIFYAYFLWWLVLNIMDQLMKNELEGLKSLVLGTFDGVRGKTGKGRYP